MRNSLYSKKQLFTWIAFVWVLSAALSGFAQVKKPFAKRMDFNVQGDFTMIGNTNLTLSSYSQSTGNGDEKMKYVDVDDDRNTVNSSSSTLTLPTTDVNCQKIVYAGLYWSGRAHVNSSSMSFSVEHVRPAFEQNKVIRKGNTFPRTGSNLTFKTVSRKGERDNRYPQYDLSLRLGWFSTRTYQFSLTNSTSNPVRYMISGQDRWSTLASSYNAATGIITLDTPFEIVVGTTTISITKFKRNTSQNTSEANYSSDAEIFYDILYDEVGSIELNKRKVKLKIAGDQYQEIEAAESDIYYPNNEDGNMYAAYADVTDYVQAKGVGEYFVADMALRAGNGGKTGYYGGWGMVIVYESPGATRRAISVFDGYAYVAGSTTASYELPISGFRAAQTADARVTLGLMAGEGDVDIEGDYFDIRNASNTQWRSIDRNTGITTSVPDRDENVNFFNSTINTGGNARNPELINNTGMDLARFDLVNSGNILIGKEQVSTSFRYGSNQDTYIIYNMVFAVDAYEPEVIGYNRPVNYNGSLPTHNGTVQPGQEMAFELDLYNKGSDALTNTRIEIPIPFNLHYVAAEVASGYDVGGSVTWIPPQGGSADPSVTAGGTIVWTAGELPLDPTQSRLLGKLSYRLKVSENCVLLATTSCGLEMELNGRITGEGKASAIAVNAPFVREYSTDLCAQPNLEGFIMNLNLSDSFLASCSPPVEQGILHFKAVCSTSTSNEFEREEVVAAYPIGTKFFSVEPTSYESTTGLVNGNFSLNANGSPKNYYAVIPSMEAGCYALLTISKDSITTVPTASDASFCLNESIVLDHALSSIGAANNYELFYFNDQGQMLTTRPNPTAVGVYHYAVAEGKGACYGAKVPFVITIVDSPTISTPIADISICENFDSSIIAVTASGTSYTWEYATPVAPTTWNTLTNTTFNQVVVVTNTTIKIEGATTAINGIKVRLKVRRGNCESLSNTSTIYVNACPGISNPMLFNPAIL